MRYVAVRNASSKNFKDIEASSKRERPTSTLCVGVFSQQNHFVDGHGAGDLMHNSNVGKKEFKFSYSPPMSLYTVRFFLLKNLSTTT
jgi:hypothetical protein